MQLQTGEVLEHIESGVEAVYKAAVPTLGHGLLHILVGPTGYLHKFTSELEQDFKVPQSEVALPAVSDPFAGITSDDIQKLLALLHAQGGTTAAAQVAPTQEQVAPAAEPGLDKAPAAAEPAAPAAAPAQSGGIPL
jgi:hypothetical protein